MTVPPVYFELSLIIFQFSFRKVKTRSYLDATSGSACIFLAAESWSLAGLGGWSSSASRGALVAFADLLYVVAGLGVRRDFVTKLQHRSLASVVAREHEVDPV